MENLEENPVSQTGNDLPQKQGVVPPETSKKSNLLKVILLSLLGLILVGGAIYGAYTLGGKKQTPQPVLPKQEETAKPSPTPDETAGWKTILDTQVGIYFKYPEDLLPYSNTPQTTPDHSLFSLEAFNNEEKRDHRMLQEADLELDFVVYKSTKDTTPYLSAIKAADNTIVTQPFPGISGSYTKVKTIADGGLQRAIIYEEPKNEYAEYDAIIIDSNNNVATIRLMTGSHDKRQELLPLLDQILATFKFLD